jgi:hypothetical protein
VTFAEFAGEFDSPLAAAVIGHQAWRNDPPYLEVKAGDDVRVKNLGGRPHTFTRWRHSAAARCRCHRSTRG